MGLSTAPALRVSAVERSSPTVHGCRDQRITDLQKGTIMTSEETQCWREFVQAFPLMKDHVVRAGFQPDHAPKTPLDAVAFITCFIWCWDKGYGDRERLRKFLSCCEAEMGRTSSAGAA